MHGGDNHDDDETEEDAHYKRTNTVSYEFIDLPMRLFRFETRKRFNRDDVWGDSRNTTKEFGWMR